MRPRRRILSRSIYEICFKTTHGLPFVCTWYMRRIIRGIIARVQRDQKVILCHDLWMSNHVHMIVKALDQRQCAAFHGEIKKQLTEAIRRLLGIRGPLSLWQENGTSVVHYGDLAAVQYRIAYLYANPARANLVDRIEHYPGESTWGEFMAAPHTLEAAVEVECPWIQARDIPRLPARGVSEIQDQLFDERLLTGSRTSHRLVVNPNSWMSEFGVTSPERVKVVNQQILITMRGLEEEARLSRLARGWKVKGAGRLRREEISLRYRESKRSIRIFVYAIDAATRIQMIEEYRDFCVRCTECYQRWKMGDYGVKWPPGAYRPPSAQTANFFDL